MGIGRKGHRFVFVRSLQVSTPRPVGMCPNLCTYDIIIIIIIMIMIMIMILLIMLMIFIVLTVIVIIMIMIIIAMTKYY